MNIITKRVQPTIWLLEGFIENPATEQKYSFWFEYDGRDGSTDFEVVAVLEDIWPDFDYEAFEKNCMKEIEAEWNK